MSDHLLTLTLLKQTKLVDKTPLAYKSRKLTNGKIESIKQRLKETDWNGILNSEDCNINFNIFNEELTKVMENMAPEVTIRISGHQKFMEPWMTTGIETSNSKCQRLYQKTLAPNCTNETQQKYRVFRGILNQVKRQAKVTYYNNKSVEYKHKLWQLINSQLGKCKHRGNIIPHISVDGIRTYEPKVKANSFGMNLASTIKPG